MTINDYDTLKVIKTLSPLERYSLKLNIQSSNETFHVGDFIKLNCSYDEQTMMINQLDEDYVSLRYIENY